MVIFIDLEPQGRRLRAFQVFFRALFFWGQGQSLGFEYVGLWLWAKVLGFLQGSAVLRWRKLASRQVFVLKWYESNGLGGGTCVSRLWRSTFTGYLVALLQMNYLGFRALEIGRDFPSS